MNDPTARNRWARFADRFGATASFLCAIHCALLPFLVAVLPALGLGFLADHRYERAFILFATLLALTSLAGAMIALDDATNLHATLVAIGGTLVACAHIVNMRLTHGHVHDATCQH